MTIACPLSFLGCPQSWRINSWSEGQWSLWKAELALANVTNRPPPRWMFPLSASSLESRLWLGSGAAQRRCLRAAATVVVQLQSGFACACCNRLEPDAKSATSTSSERGPAGFRCDEEVSWIERSTVAAG